MEKYACYKSASVISTTAIFPLSNDDYCFIQNFVNSNIIISPVVIIKTLNIFLIYYIIYNKIIGSVAKLNLGKGVSRTEQPRAMCSGTSSSLNVEKK
jgi:hypothetical protein